MAADENTVPPTDDVRSGHEERVSELLNDGEAREVLIRRLVEGCHMAERERSLMRSLCQAEAVTAEV